MRLLPYLARMDALLALHAAFTPHRKYSRETLLPAYDVRQEERVLHYALVFIVTLAPYLGAWSRSSASVAPTEA